MLLLLTAGDLRKPIEVIELRWLVQLRLGLCSLLRLHGTALCLLCSLAGGHRTLSRLAGL